METVEAESEAGGICMDLKALEYISPDDYDTWTKVGMALQHEGFDVSVWDDWSRGSRKYKGGECEKKWR